MTISIHKTGRHRTTAIHLPKWLQDYLTSFMTAALASKLPEVPADMCYPASATIRVGRKSGKMTELSLYMVCLQASGTKFAEPTHIDLSAFNCYDGKAEEHAEYLGLVGKGQSFEVTIAAGEYVEIELELENAFGNDHLEGVNIYNDDGITIQIAPDVSVVEFRIEPRHRLQSVEDPAPSILTHAAVIRGIGYCNDEPKGAPPKFDSMQFHAVIQD